MNREFYQFEKLAQREQQEREQAFVLEAALAESSAPSPVARSLGRLLVSLGNRLLGSETRESRMLLSDPRHQ